MIFMKTTDTYDPGVPDESADSLGWKQEGLLMEQSEAFLGLLQRRGILVDDQIDDEARRRSIKDRKRKTYHNTLLMLQNYRNISWALESFPEEIAEELDRPLESLDALLSLLDTEIIFGNYRLESRLQSVQKSRLLLDRINDALTVLKKKPKDGPILYKVIYETFIAPEHLTIAELVYRLNISARHYYRLRSQAINVLALRLWSAPAEELDSWLEVLTLLELR
jgi:DNA-directed RNA polymerase specialized sigma subunit